MFCSGDRINIDFVFLTETNGIQRTNKKGEFPDQTSVWIGSKEELSSGSEYLNLFFELLIHYHKIDQYIHDSYNNL